jgi:hypothetical protein
MKGYAHEANVVGVGYCHRYIPPKTINCHVSSYGSLSYCHNQKTRHQVHAATENVASYQKIVAIAHYLQH